MPWVGVITNDGESLLEQWIDEATLIIESAATGTGTVAESAMMAQTALVSQQQTASVISLENTDAGKKIRLQITAPESGYTLNQYGVWASINGGTPKLLALYQNDTGLEIPSSADSPDFVYTFYAILAVANDGAMSLTVDTSAIVTHDAMDAFVAAAIAGKQDAIAVEGMLKGSGSEVQRAVPGEDYVAPEALNAYQTQILLLGLLKGDGEGGIAAALPGEDYGFPLLSGSTDPDSSSAASVGQHYFNTTTGKEWICTGRAGNVYSWYQIGGIKLLTATLSANGWSNSRPYMQTVSVAGIVAAGANYIVAPAAASADAYSQAGVYMQDPTGADAATFVAEISKPTGALSVLILKVEVG